MPVRTVDAEDLHARAVAAGSAGRHDESLRLLESARAATDDPDLLARIDLTASYAEAETGDPDAAMARCRAVLARGGTRAQTQGLAHSQLGLLWMRRSQHEQALAELGLAIARLEEPGSLAVAHLNRGNVHLQRADAFAARADFARAAEHYAAAEDPVGAAKARFNQAYGQLLTGDLVGALQGMEQAGDVLAPLSPAHAATVAQDRAEVLRAAGRVREAAASLETAASAYGEQGLPRYQAECEFVLAGTLLDEAPARAREVARRAARRLASTGNTAWATRAEALALVADIAAGSTAPTIPRRADDLAVALRTAGQRRDRVQLLLAVVRLLVRRGDLDAASDRLRRLRVPTDAPVTLRIQRHQAAAELQRARGHAGRARQHARSGLAELHRWQSSFGSLDLQSTLVGHGEGLARIGLEQALADGDPRLVLEWSERARALAARVTPVRPPRDPELAAALTDLRLLPSDHHGRRQQLQEQVRQRSWYVAGGGQVEEPIGLAQLQEQLAASGAALLAHIALGGRLHGLVVTERHATIVPLGQAVAARRLLDRVAADLDTAAAHRSGALGAAVRATLDADLGGLADQLVAPLLTIVGDRRLVLTPSALLAGVPWSLLPGLRGRPLTVAVSATRWHRSTRSPRRARRAIGLVAGPHVARAAEEVRRAAACWPNAAVLTGAEATAAAVQRLAADVDVLHLAGHGRHAGDHPLFSAVQLHDGPWYGHDVETLSHVPSVVVLSACELGRSTVRSAEETVGMTAAWLHAGAGTVVSAPVLVADDLACEVLADWHRRLAAGSPPADALADATSTSGEPAPFLCHGTGW